ncbi:VacJ family lipoprotein [Hyphomicrobium sp.]|uniref:MlaA family lipoprotein n=1 Tax=Hyphomicrobium sp. TaxID=82 RepID=UPI0025C0E037|nr:VacJ family lipoprotein [Hyphomicrobium sp.]
MKFRAIFNLTGSMMVAAGMSACAGSPMSLPPAQYLASPEKDEEPKAISDPNEAFNRAVFETNQKFNHSILYPVAKAYNENVPQAVRDRVDAFSTNLSEPMVFANNILQLRPKAAATTLGRFALNSTIGVGGLFDVAVAQGLDHQSGDFGQTMFVWGYRDSSYLVLPIVGPTNVRDAMGSGIEFAAQLDSGALLPASLMSMKSVADFVEDVQPVTNAVGVAGSVSSPLTNLSKAQDMETLEDSSLDFYTMLRSVTDQKRQAELQEALDTSALTSTPPPPDPNAIEPVTVLVSSPTMLEVRRVVDASKPASPDTGTMVIIGPPKPAEAPIAR